MANVERPLSPHLQIYRPQLTSVLSVSHRATGIALAAGTLLLVWWLVAAAVGEDAYETAQDWIGSWIGVLALIVWSYALFYHLLNGIRHLVWDAGYGFELDVAYKSGWAVVIGSVALTVVAWLIGLIAY